MYFSLPQLFVFFCDLLSVAVFVIKVRFFFKARKKEKKKKKEKKEEKKPTCA